MTHKPAMSPRIYVLAANLLKATSLFKKNVVVSPVPLVTSLSALASASELGAKDALLRILGYASKESLEASFLPILPTNEFFAASSFWFKFQGNPPDYVLAELQRFSDIYGLVTRAIPPAVLATASVDDYVQQASGGRMETCDFASDVLKSDMAILDLAGFYDCWDKPFKDIESEIFHGLTSDSSVDMLTAKCGGIVYHGEKAGYLKKKYSNPRYSFIAIEPYEFAEFAASFSSKDIEDAVDFLCSPEAKAATIGIPRFSIQSENELNVPLKAFGLGPIFDPQDGTFSGLFPNLAVSRVCQTASIFVDEFGTEATAQQLTQVRVGASPAYAKYVEPVILNNPFIYFIYDEELDIPLFIGTMVDFKKSKALEFSSESLEEVENAPKQEKQGGNSTIKIIVAVTFAIILLAFVFSPMGFLMLPLLIIVAAGVFSILRYVQFGAAAVGAAQPLLRAASDKVRADSRQIEAEDAKQAEELQGANLYFEGQDEYIEPEEDVAQNGDYRL